MVVIRDGTSLIAAGLDHWYEPENRNANALTDQNDFRIEEWRLERQLRVDHFRLPPDYREPRIGQSIPNALLTVPFLRFPQWNVCQWCHLLTKRPLTDRGRVICEECGRGGRRSVMSQVRFVAMCEHAHLQDFPWREWVHHSADPTCTGQVRLSATGGASLSGERVSCDGCNRTRTLASIMEASGDGNRPSTYVTDNLADGAKFSCQGKTPWLGTEEGQPCTMPLRGSLRSATNLYFSHVRNAIYLPRSTPAAPAALVALMEAPPLSVWVRLAIRSDLQVGPGELRAAHGELLHQFNDEQIRASFAVVVSGEKSDRETESQQADVEDESDVRRDEYRALLAVRNDDDLKIQGLDPRSYNDTISSVFTRVMLVHRLRETRVFTGFSRTFSENELTLDDRKSMLRRSAPTGRDSWLPGYVVHGEGIFLEFDQRRIEQWERREDVNQRIAGLVQRYGTAQQDRRLRIRAIDARLVLLHTFSHLLINRLTFECGYSSAALRERLYVATDSEHPMAGILIYTAAGDSEGTMGGLVRMGKPGYLDPIVIRAIEEAQWCSADPVCMELGAHGQGPDSCNLAACHNCALVPETACEEFNRFLDRALVIGDVSNRSLGFFPEMPLTDHPG